MVFFTQEVRFVTKQEIGGILMNLRENAGKTREEVAELLGKSVKTVGHWETGYAQPDANTLFLLCTIYGADLNASFGFPTLKKEAPSYSNEALKIADNYDKLDSWGQRVVNSVIADEQARIAAAQRPDQNEDDIIYFSITDYDSPMSAGTGQPAGDGYGHSLLLIKEPPPGTSYVAPIAGDSMEPTYHNGDRLFVQACYSINVGEVGVFLMDGQQWVKELGEGVLISHNPKYEPRPMTEDIRCQGRVLGVCDESYLEV